jgi:hypothetical protein
MATAACMSALSVRTLALPGFPEHAFPAQFLEPFLRPTQTELEQGSRSDLSPAKSEQIIGILREQETGAKTALQDALTPLRRYYLAFS